MERKRAISIQSGTQQEPDRSTAKEGPMQEAEESQYGFGQNEAHSKVKFEVYGEEMIEKEVKSSGNSGRLYLPPDWIGKCVKIIRL